ncbi:hypothetical protein OAH34_00285 [bacterium]|jgi:hypothetical protein|nr:hypothetical protein [bacterium]
MYPPHIFKENGYIKVENFITKDMADYLYTYVKQTALNTALLHEMYGQEIWDKVGGFIGVFNDPQAFGDYSRYGDPTFDSLLQHKISKVEQITGLQLTPTYTYHRLYTTGTELVRHKDRPSCEISTTLCLGYDSDYNWPMFVSKEDGGQGEPIYLNPGDMIIYRGCEIEHWREPFKGLNHAQVFFHYNEKNGQYDIPFDGRPNLGLPIESVLDKKSK